MAQFICRYRKGPEVRWISHLDLKRTLERAMRRAGLALELTKGHNPHPKISYGPPLPLGATGEAELFAFHLTEAADPTTIKQRLSAQLPPGIELTEVWSVPAHRKKETFGEVDLAEYSIRVAGRVDAAQVRKSVGKLLESEALLVQRGGERPEREVDLRPLINSLELTDESEQGITLRARLTTGSHGGARPQEIVQLLGLESADNPVTYHRAGLYASAEAPTSRPRGVLRRWGRRRSAPRKG
ncbi:MAG: TIGR03936 family radical SAM-associated protein [Armatimonadota bacterium]